MDSVRDKFDRIHEIVNGEENVFGTVIINRFSVIEERKKFILIISNKYVYYLRICMLKYFCLIAIYLYYRWFLNKINIQTFKNRISLKPGIINYP